MDYTDAIIGVYAGQQCKRFFVLSYTCPVYMFEKQKQALDARYQFFQCRPKAEPKRVKRPHHPGRALVLFDTKEIGPGIYLKIRKSFDLDPVTEFASANDKTAVRYAMGYRPELVSYK